MAIRKFWTIAFRDLLRNRRRSFLTAVAIALSMVVLLTMASFLAGIIEGGLTENIRLNTGHIQLRAASYDAEKLSLLSRDLLADSEALVAQVEAVEGVMSAAPVLWAGGIVSTIRESAGIRLAGIDPDDAFHAPIRDGIVAGSFLSRNGRREIVIGQRLANNLDIRVGQQISLAAGSGEGSLTEGIFIVVGLFNTGVPSYDQTTVMMSLSQAQTYLKTRDRASSIILMLENRDDAARVASALERPAVQILTWVDLNEILLTTVQTGAVFYYIIYTIIILVVAVLIANTLLMSVFERTREIGILSALGMKRRQIMVSILFEAAILALIGIAAGIVLGLGVVSYLARVGFSLGEDIAATVEGLAYGSRMYAAYDPGQYLVLSLFLLTVVLLVSLYPAWYAAKMEPVEALHAF